MIRLVDQGTISNSVARQELFPEIYATGKPPAELVQQRGLEQVSDEAWLEELIHEVLRESPEQLALYRGGKTGLLGYFVGQVMKASGGKANPRKVSELLRRAIG